jgi:spore germination protein GerM
MASVNPTRPRRTVVGVGVTIFGIVTFASCGVQTGPSSFERIADEDLPNRLGDPSTTTSTSTTSTTSMPETPQTPQSTVASSTTIVPTESVDVYFLSLENLKPIGYDVTAPIRPFDIVNDLAGLLERGPIGPSAGLTDNAVPRGLFNDDPFSEQGGVLTIDLNGQTFQEIDGRQKQREAIAQIVYTFLSNLVGVGSVRFTLDGQPLVVPDGNGLNTDVPVSRDDYAGMLIDVGPPDSAPPDSSPTTTGVVVNPDPAPIETTEPT